jgi:hypothetical protein
MQKKAMRSDVYVDLWRPVTELGSTPISILFSALLMTASRSIERFLGD